MRGGREALPGKCFIIQSELAKVFYMTFALVVAGGLSRRMGFDKLTVQLGGKPVLRWTVEAFDRHPGIGKIVVVVHAERLEEMRGLLSGLEKVEGVVPGGAERHLSVWAGLRYLAARNCSVVAVHDGARPLIDGVAISACLEVAVRHGAATCARPVTETLKRAGDNGFLGEAVDREGLWAMETPQAARFELLHAAYVKLMADGVAVTDENSALQRAGVPVKIVETGSPNMKITYPSDLRLAEAWLCAMRTGG